MSLWHCVIWTHGAGGRNRHLLDVTADTKGEAEVMAFEHYTELADDEVMKKPEDPTPLILHDIEVSGGYVGGAACAVGSAVVCPDCGNPNLQRSGVCHVCPICGATTGCS